MAESEHGACGFPFDGLPASSQPLAAAIHDPERLAALKKTRLLDLAPSEAFDRLTRIAVAATQAPVAYISLVDATRDFYLSQSGWGEPRSSSRELTGRTFCHYGLLQDGPLVLEDIAATPVFQDLPAVSTLGVRAYLGLPVTDACGQRLGSFCVVDFKPRTWSQADVQAMTDLALTAMDAIDAMGLRPALEHSESLALQRAEEAAKYQALLQQSELGRAIVDSCLDALPSMVGYWDAKLINRYANQAYSKFFKRHPKALIDCHLRDLLGEDLYRQNEPYVLQALRGESVHTPTLRCSRKLPRSFPTAWRSTTKGNPCACTTGPWSGTWRFQRVCWSSRMFVW